ncbi:hypothetical protein HYT24_02115 [Candidatus Pacearchaeota archaeon]|nr:hypothetical protein [Candidatus Pacearchaeota archaeon]
MEENKGVDGVKRIITNTGIPLTFFNVYEALEDKNPRNVFLNGQLYVEDRVDAILSWYFGYDNSVRHSSIIKFLKSEYCSFISKIRFLSMLIHTDKPNNKGNREVIPFINNKKIISGLITIGEVRNSFQHNLVLQEAFNNVIKDGRKFSLIDKRLDSCKDLNDLVGIFKEEVILLVKEIDSIFLSEFPTLKISIEDLKKALTSPASDKEDKIAISP